MVLREEATWFAGKLNKKKIPYLHQSPLPYPLIGYPLGEVEHQLEVAPP